MQLRFGFNESGVCTEGTTRTAGDFVPGVLRQHYAALLADLQRGDVGNVAQAMGASVRSVDDEHTELETLAADGVRHKLRDGVTATVRKTRLVPPQPLPMFTADPYAVRVAAATHEAVASDDVAAAARGLQQRRRACTRFDLRLRQPDNDAGAANDSDGVRDAVWRVSLARVNDGAWYELTVDMLAPDGRAFAAQYAEFVRAIVTDERRLRDVHRCVAQPLLAWLAAQTRNAVGGMRRVADVDEAGAVMHAFRLPPDPRRHRPVALTPRTLASSSAATHLITYRVHGARAYMLPYTRADGERALYFYLPDYGLRCCDDETHRFARLLLQQHQALAAQLWASGGAVLDGELVVCDDGQVRFAVADIVARGVTPSAASDMMRRIECERRLFECMEQRAAETGIDLKLYSRTMASHARHAPGVPTDGLELCPLGGSAVAAHAWWRAPDSGAPTVAVSVRYTVDTHAAQFWVEALLGGDGRRDLVLYAEQADMLPTDVAYLDWLVRYEYAHQLAAGGQSVDELMPPVIRIRYDAARGGYELVELVRERVRPDTLRHTRVVAELAGTRVQRDGITAAFGTAGSRKRPRARQ